jgi:putative acetyltransferase
MEYGEIIRIDDLRGPEIAALLAEHLHEMRSVSPRESAHALDLDELRDPAITFWTVWHGGELVGCGALKELDADTGEIKSMRTARAARGRGIGARLLRHIVSEATGRGYVRLFLETGSMAFFEPARQLYLRHGFELCPPFADYREDPNSVFMTLELRRG